MDALPKDVKQKDKTIPATAIQYVNKLFEIENRLEVLSAEGRKEQRLIQEKPVLEPFGRGQRKHQKKYLPVPSWVLLLPMHLIKKKD